MNDSGHGVITAIYDTVDANPLPAANPARLAHRRVEAAPDASDDTEAAWAPMLHSLCTVLSSSGARLDLERPALRARAQEASVDASDGGLGASGHFIDESDGDSQTLAMVGHLPCRADIGHVLRLTLPLEDGARLRLLVARRKGGAPFEAREQAFAEQIVRHIERARQLGSSSRDPGPLRLRELEARGVPALLVDVQARLVALNPSAQTFVADAGFRWCSGKAIAFEQEAGSEAFGAIVRESLRVDGRRLFLSRGGGSGIEHTAFVVSPLPASPPLRDAAVPQPPARGLALVTIVRRDRPLVLAADWLHELFGLTPMESRIAASIASGCSPELTAKHCGLAIGTVRWHLKRVFAKTSCAGQTELVALLQALAHTL